MKYVLNSTQMAVRSLLFIGLLVLFLLGGATPGWAQTGNWVTVAPSGTPTWVGFSVMINNKMYVFSGFDSPSVTTTAKCQVYDPATNTWSYIADMPFPVTHAGIAVDGTKVYVAGGFLSGQSGGPNSDKLQIYDVATNTWSQGTPLPTKSGGNALVRIGRKLHSFGGLLEDRQTGSMAHYVLDLNNVGAGWGVAAGMPLPRCHFASGAVAGKIYALGGQTGHDGAIADVNYVQVYDPSTDVWTRLQDMPYVRSHSEPATCVVDGTIVLAGGRSGRPNGTDNVIPNVTVYNPATDSWTEQLPLPVNLFGPSAEMIGNEYIVANGGLNQSTNPQTTTRKRSQTRTPNNTIGFWPSQVTLSAVAGASASRDIILWTKSGNPSYSIDTSGLPAWLSVSPTSGTIDLLGGTEIKVTANAGSLAAGTYTASITAKATGYPDATANITFTVSGSKPKILYLYGSIPPSIHDMKLSDTGSLGMSQFNQALLDAGFTTTEALDANTTLNAATLNGYKVLILSSNNRRFTAAEAAAVATWVNAGGGVVAWSDAAFGWQNGGANSSEGMLSDNDIMLQFGMQFLHDNTQGAFTMDQWAVNHYINNFNKNAGLTIEAEGVSPIRTTTPATIIANLPPIAAHLNSLDGPLQANDAALSVAKIGQGRAAGFFDRNCFWNAGDGTYLSRVQNKAFAQRLIQWVAGADDSAPSGTPPLANAGPDQTINLPTSSVILAGSGTPASGSTITGYTWSQAGGPATASFSSTSVANPTVSGLTQAGSYTFSLVVTDNKTLTSIADQVTIYVNPATAGGPAVYRINAGGGTLTTSLGTFAPDQYYSGSAYTYSTGNAIAGTNDDALYQTERSSSTDKGAYSYDFPVANGTYTVTLHFADIYWSSVGQRIFDVSIEGAKVLDNYDIIRKVGAFTATTETFTTTVSDGTLNIYFSALAADGGVDRPKISAIEIFNATSGGNPAPVANAGPDQTITLPASSVTLAGAGTDDGSIKTYTWSQAGGPTTATFAPGKTAQNPTVSGLTQAGTYVFSLVVTDNLDAPSAADQVTITVNPAPTGQPTAVYRLNSGGGALTTSIGAFATDQYFSPNPGSTYSTGSAIAGTTDDALYQTERFGTNFSYALPVANGTYTVKLHFAEIYWTAVGQRVFDVSLEGNKVLSAYDIFKKVGTNVATVESFPVTVSDGTLNLNLTSLNTGGKDNAKISAIEVLSTTSGSNPAPVANAGPDQTITLPTSSVTLAGAGTDDGSIKTYTWSQASGPLTATFAPGKTVAAPTVSGLTQAGTYVFSLVVTDNLDAPSAADQVQITVNPVPSSPQQVTSLTLMNADTDQPIRDLVANDVLNLATLPTQNLNVRANTSPYPVGSVVLVLSGTVNRTQVETSAPYALFGNSGPDYAAWPAPVGSYTLKATPYTSSGGNGTAGMALTVNFTVTNQAALTASGLSAALKGDKTSGFSSVAAVYPNPSDNGRFRLSLPEAFQGEVSYTLVSAVGATLGTGKLTPAASGTLLELDFSQQMPANGIYYLHINGQKAQAHLKLIRR
ncbi:malectin domain-containing carbohydrate-binding protein [Hymenobacter sp. BT491]|uniref:malectin domain-containing carbohydrate-binding protein n=1 Tax=Hymenobacter sp. BT491 TaxID=2766779 RepID=UPI001653A2A3|nr:malectin domain-containing carbohydrate-binding protein [Hymenobacter sp. BT491]MBC6989261.1 hypothetical protein [Hymenobacter sp. BT491]